MNTRKVEDEIANRLAFVIGMLPYSVSEIADRLSVSKLNISLKQGRLPLPFVRTFAMCMMLIIIGFSRAKENHKR